jgi:hypothetical protein
METLKRLFTISLIVSFYGVIGLAQENTPANSPNIVEVYINESAIVLKPTASDAISVDLSTDRLLPYTIHAGEIAIIIFDGQDSRESSLGQLYTLRRELKAKAWTIAISTSPCEKLPMRTQLTLCEDDPVDVLLTPTALPQAYEMWGLTKCIAYPSKDNPLVFKTKSFTLPIVAKQE